MTAEPTRVCFEHRPGYTAEDCPDCDYPQRAGQWEGER